VREDVGFLMSFYLQVCMFGRVKSSRSSDVQKGGFLATLRVGIVLISGVDLGMTKITSKTKHIQIIRDLGNHNSGRL